MRGVSAPALPHALIEQIREEDGGYPVRLE
jgi:hypothetical protein